jgi:hypothetical protein
MSAVTRHVIVIERRFHGPPQSGHGGYTYGLLAPELQGAAPVSLGSPPPPERPLTIEPDDERLLRGTARRSSPTPARSRGNSIPHRTSSSPPRKPRARDASASRTIHSRHASDTI